MSEGITLITGTRKGIGRFLAEHYAKLGHRVIGCSRQPADWSHPNYQHVLADVCEEEQVTKLFQTIRSEYGRLDHLINNAGIAAMNHSLLTPMSVVDRMLKTNVAGTFLCCREAAKIMKANKFGRIVNFSTVAVPLKLEGEAIYAASKAAVISLSEVLSREFAELGITVNAIGPTPIDTDLIRNVPKSKLDQLVGRQAIHRFGTFEDVLNVVDFFMRPESQFVTGQTIFLGGV